MAKKCFLICGTAKIGIYERRGADMLMCTRSVPWTLKACTIGAVVTRTLSATETNTRQEHVLLAVCFMTLASVLPSVVSCVADRRKTTAYIVHSALFLVCTHGALAALHRWQHANYTVAVTQTCVVHLLWSQWRALSQERNILIYQDQVRWLVAATALLSWCVCALMLPRISPDIVALVGLMFVGEVLGVIASMSAAILVSIGDTAELCLTDTTS